jgi:hypothetical protein
VSKATSAGPAAAILLLVAFGACGEPAAPPVTYSPGLADIMIATQIRHAKLWLAGEARNWALADYEIDELKEGLEDVVQYFPVYKDMPVGTMVEATIMSPIEEVEKAIKARDPAKFVDTFDQLTAACNNCHQAANRAFIVIQRPSSSTYPNQSFAPRRD